MLFAYATDDQSLISFKSEAEAVAYAEGIDVEDGTWLFYADDGTPLEPAFSIPNKRGAFAVLSGQYVLRTSAKLGHIKDVLDNVATFEGEFRSREEVEHFLTLSK